MLSAIPIGCLDVVLPLASLLFASPEILAQGRGLPVAARLLLGPGLVGQGGAALFVGHVRYDGESACVRQRVVS